MHPAHEQDRSGLPSRPSDSQCVTSPGNASRVHELIWGFMTTQAIHAGCKLGVFDLLAKGKRTASDIALHTGSNPPSMQRLLRFLASIGIVVEDDGSQYSCTSLGEWLQPRHPQSLHGLALLFGAPFMWSSWGDFAETVRTGQPAFERVLGSPVFEHLSNVPEDAAVFNFGMTSSSAFDIPSIVATVDFSRFSTIVDVGGGHGALMKAILGRFPSCQGILCDLPSVITSAEQSGWDKSVRDRCSLAACDFFASVPTGGDAYVLRKILHDWNDEECIRILTNCRRSCNAGARLFVIEALVKPGNQPDPAKWIDLQMLTSLSGRERTEQEFMQLFAASGFELVGTSPLGLTTIIQAIAVR